MVKFWMGKLFPVGIISMFTIVVGIGIPHVIQFGLGLFQLSTLALILFAGAYSLSLIFLVVYIGWSLWQLQDDFE